MTEPYFEWKPVPGRFQIVTPLGGEIILLDTVGGVTCRLDPSTLTWNQLPVNFLPDPSAPTAAPTPVAQPAS